MSKNSKPHFPKVSTGVSGLDEITLGGYPKGRPVLICGSAGCGKTMFGIQFLVKGITDHNEPGVLMSFEESSNDLSKNVRSLGFDLERLKKENKLRVDYVRIEPSEIEETGEYDLEGLFIRLNHAIDEIGAKRVVLDTLESLFAGISNMAVLRAEIRRLFSWLKEKGVTAVITGEQGVNTLTRHGLEEYISDCVILLDFRIIDQIATRRLRIVKYRGSTHGTNEYPFLIDENGLSVLPVTSLKMEYIVSRDIVSTGHPGLDKLFSKGGIYQGGSTLISGAAGTLKTILAAHFAVASCLRGEKVIYFSFEESSDQIVRNMKSIGIDMSPHLKKGHLTIHASRPSLQGLEMHLLVLLKLIKQIQPQMVVVDPISNLITIGKKSEVRTMLIRLIDDLKINNINAVFTTLTSDISGGFKNEILEAVSSLADTWIDCKNKIVDGERTRILRIVKTRGMGHYNNPVVCKISDSGLDFGSTVYQKHTKATT